MWLVLCGIIIIVSGARHKKEGIEDLSDLVR